MTRGKLVPGIPIPCHRPRAIFGSARTPAMWTSGISRLLLKAHSLSAPRTCNVSLPSATDNSTEATPLSLTRLSRDCHVGHRIIPRYAFSRVLSHETCRGQVSLLWIRSLASLGVSLLLLPHLRIDGFSSTFPYPSVSEPRTGCR